MCPFANLPSELIADIFALAATTCRESALALCLVSSWARAIALRYLLTTVILREREHVTSFASFLQKDITRSPSEGYKPGLLVRHLSTLSIHTEALLPMYGILAQCPNIINLAVTDYQLWSIFRTHPAGHESTGSISFSNPRVHVTVETEGNPTRNMVAFWSAIKDFYHVAPPSRCPLFDMVTHLRFRVPYRGYQDIRGLKFPNLTHLAVSGYVHSPSNVDQLCELSDQLDMVVLIADFPRDSYGPSVRTEMHQQRTVKRVYVNRYRILQGDSRIFFLETCREDVGSDWEMEISGEDTIWKRAIRQTIED